MLPARARPTSSCSPSRRCSPTRSKKRSSRRAHVLASSAYTTDRGGRAYGPLPCSRRFAPALLLLPFEIAAKTGQRQGDILALSWVDYDGTHLRFRQSKGGKKLKVRVH